MSEALTEDRIVQCENLMPRILLDPDEDADPLAGFRIIDTEVDFLDHAISEIDLLIRGYSLCQWAESFYSGRKIGFSAAPSLSRDLRRTYGNLSDEQARFLCRELTSRNREFSNYSPQEILSACFPIYLWDSPASIKHAANWLLWLDEAEPNPAFKPILSTLVLDWQQEQPELAEIYDALTPESARLVLEKWLGADLTPFIEKFMEFPDVVSDKWIDRLCKTWASKLVKTQGAFFGHFLRAPTLWKLKVALAKVALDYFEKNPDFITEETCNQLARFVSGKDIERVAKLRPVPVPREVPDSPDEVMKWFVNEYLPFRSWQMGTNTQAAFTRALDLGRQFAEWYLRYYPVALNSKQHISFFRSQSLHSEHPEAIHLMVILDGLHYLDAQIVKNALLSAKEIRHLEMIENDLCFAPIPTVTEFAKGALVRGVQPSMIKEMKVLGPDIPERDTPINELRLANPGDLIIWRIQEPDSAYHMRNKNTTLRMEIESLLEMAARKILDVIEQVPFSKDLRIVVTTDHGRYLGVSKRVIEVPPGMEAHGRAAWGKSSREFSKTGYLVEDEVAYLSRHRFGLESFDADVAVILSDNAFKDNRHEQEYYPHGGLFPEEVILPWMVFARNVEKPRVEVTLSGDGDANKPGKMRITITNPSQMTLGLVRCEFSFGPDKMISLEKIETLPAYKETLITVDIPSWPSSEEVGIGKARIVMELPSGDEFEENPPLTDIKVNEIYTRDKSLLEGLDL